MLRRVLFLVYGIVAHVMFVGVVVYMIGFIGNIGVPKSIDSEPTSPLWFALLVNASLIGLFGVQHSVMARPTFKRWWTRIIPEPIERSTYVLLSNLLLALLMWKWEPMGGVIWNVTEPVTRALLVSLFLSSWLLIVFASLLINHFDLFGTRQVWLHFRGRPYTHLPFRTPMLYAYVRHPLYVGWIMAFWITPTMTVAHLVFATLLTAYILIAVRFEERNLIEAHGPAYADYRRRVGMFVPNPAIGKSEPRTEPAAA
jgi:protein-S-isoprenylcysteine O-methyltransferase Ste14